MLETFETMLAKQRVDQLEVENIPPIRPLEVSVYFASVPTTLNLIKVLTFG
jgi:hypothetical protein